MTESETRIGVEHAPDGEGVEILVAEDDEINLYVLMAMLQANGYEPLVAIDGVEAVQMALRERPSVVLMDLAMPRLDGLSAARKIREKLSSDACRIIAVTAHVTERQRRDCRNAGFDAFVGKPFEFEVLSDLIVRALRGEALWEADAGSGGSRSSGPNLTRPCASRAG